MAVMPGSSATAGSVAADTKAASKAAGTGSASKPAAAKVARAAESKAAEPRRIQDQTLRIRPGYRAGRAVFGLAGRPATRYTLSLSGRGAVTPPTKSVSVFTNRAGSATAVVPVTLTGDRIGGILADISSTVAGQQQVTSTSVWLHPDRTGKEVVGQSAVDALLKATKNDPAGRAAGLAKMAAVPSSGPTVRPNVQANVAPDQIQVQGTASWTDWAVPARTHPARHIVVRIQESGQQPPYTDQTTTNDTGHYSFTIPASGTGTDVQVTFLAQNAAAQVGLDGLDPLCSTCFSPYSKVVTAPQIAAGSSVPVNMTAGINGPSDVSFAIADALWTAYLFGKRITGSGAPPINVAYPVKDKNGSDVVANTFPNGLMQIGDVYWSAWDVLNHEYGHWFDFQHQISAPISGTYVHCVDDNLATLAGKCVNDPPPAPLGKDKGTRVAWTEGFADFYAMSADHYGVLPVGLPADVYNDAFDWVQTPSAGGPSTNSGVGVDLSNPLTYHGEDNELAIAGTLFNLLDPNRSASVYSEYTGIGVERLYGTILQAHAQQFSDLVQALWPSDTSTTLSQTEQRDFSCMLSAARIAPYWGSDDNPTARPKLTGDLAVPPEISWHAGNAGKFVNDRFTVQVLDRGTGQPYFTSAELHLTPDPKTGLITWTPSDEEWAAMTRGHTDPIMLRVLGSNGSDPATGPYRGCAAIMRLDKPDCTGSQLPPTDDDSAQASLPFPVNFYGTTYTSLWVNNNGNVTFGSDLGQFVPFTLTASTPPIIAPFFADADTTGSGWVDYGTTTVGTHQAFCVNWSNVGYYDQNIDKLNSFELLLVNRQDRAPGDFDIIFDYRSIQWESGDEFSGGSGGFGGRSAAVGFSAGTGDSSQFFELPGSLVSHSFTNGDPHALVTGNFGALSTPGRYIFPVTNGKAPSSNTAVNGTTTAGGSPAPGGPIQICPQRGEACVTQTRSGSDGTYTAPGVPAGTYDVTAFPTAGVTAIPTTTTVTVADGQQSTVDLVLGTLTAPPAGTTIGPLVGSDTASPLPVVNWTDQPTLSTTGCPGGTASYQISGSGSGSPDPSWVSGPLSEVSPGQYAATVASLSPHSGYAEVDINLQCPTGTANQAVIFDIYLDPSGTVLDQTGHPVEGATVTLLRSDSADGPFLAVPNGSDLMSPANRANPVTTSQDGRFGWDVVGGYYQLTASKAGCHAADGGDTVTSPVYGVPPAIAGIHLTLTCPVADTTPPAITTTPVTLEGNTTDGYTGSLPGVTATDPDHPDDLVSLTNDAPSVLPLGANTITWTATDTAGNRSSATQTVTVIDTTAPALTCPPAVAGSYPSTPALGSPSVQDVVDAHPVLGNDAPASFPAGTTTVTWTATDHSGNQSGCSQQVTLIPPPPTVTGLNPAGGPLTGGTSVTITGAAFTGATAVNFGSLAATSFTITSDTTITATAPAAANVGTVDITVTTPAGSSAITAANHYSYLYAFTGFQAPVASPPVLNQVNRGQTIPIKFSLGGNHGLGILATGSPTATQINCADGAPINTATLTDTAGGSGLQYDSTTGTYTYVWKTSKAWAGSCQQFTLTLTDGSSHTANFQFK